MKPSLALYNNRAAIRTIVAAHRASNARVYGSTANGNYREDSDLDILVDPMPDTTLFDLGAIQFELKQLLGIRVDVCTPLDLPESFRRVVFAQAVPVCVSPGCGIISNT